MEELTPKNKQQINGLRGLFPREITIQILRSEDGGFSAEVITFPGTITEADTFSELIEMVNDAVYTNFEVPENYKAFMPTYLPTIETAQKFNVFPDFKKKDCLTMELLPIHESVS